MNEIIDINIRRAKAQIVTDVEFLITMLEARAEKWQKAHAETAEIANERIAELEDQIKNHICQQEPK